MKINFIKRRIENVAPFYISVLVTILGFAVICGWLLHVRVLVQVFPGSVPMQFNTALCFITLGICGMLMDGQSRRSKVAATIGGIILMTMGALVIFQYLSGISIGIDTLFFYPWERALSADPGRMALTTSIAFICCGFGILVYVLRPAASGVFTMSHTLPLSFGLASLLGYAFGITYVMPFHLGSQMAVHTASAFTAYSVAMLMISWRRVAGDEMMLPGIATLMLPVLFIVFGTVMHDDSAIVNAGQFILACVVTILFALAVRKFNQAKVAVKGLILISIPLIFVLGVLGLVIHLKRENVDAQFWSFHSREVIVEIESLTVSLQEMKSDVHGFVITNNQGYSQSFDNLTSRLPMQAARLRELVADNPGQSEIAAHLEETAVQYLLQGQKIMALMTAGEKDLAIREVSTGTGKRIIDEFYGYSTAFLNEEARLEKVRQQKLDNSWQQFDYLLVAGTSAIVLLAIALSFIFSRGISRRIQVLKQNAQALASGEELTSIMGGADEISDLDLVFHKMAGSIAEAARKERAIIANAPDVIGSFDSDGRFVNVSPASFNLWGYLPDEMTSCRFSQFGTAENADGAIDPDAFIRTKEPVTNFENVFRHRDGSTVNMMWNAQWSEADRLTFFVARDITESKRSQILLKEARDDALESVRLKSEFLANMSHEIRTPMNGVIGMTGLLLDTELDEEQRDYAQTVQSSADMLLRIIDDILDFSKIEAGQLKFERIDFDLRECVESTVEVLAENAQTKGIEIASLIYSDVPTPLYGDPGRLRQILVNLIGNAVKFTEKGEVTVNVQKQSETAKYVSLRFEVTDSGIGISEQAQKLLFRAFSQADGSTTRKYGGTGLGLAISKQLVEIMDGKIGIESIPGKGSTFWFTAQFEKQLHPSLASQFVGDISIEGIRVLIVDDNATNRKIFLHQTTSWGMIAAEADSGKRALEILRSAVDLKEPFEVVILDLMMPEMDGFEQARLIKSEPALSGIHLILLPSYGKKGDGQLARDFGIAAYIQKPVRQSQLYNCLTTIIAGSAVSSKSGSELSLPLITKYSLGNTIPLAINKLKGTASKVRILVAEDNLVNQKVALSQLKSLGYTADIVMNGREAVEAASKIQYDVVLMDCQMPKMDGFEATAEIRRFEGTTTHTTIIAMTAHALEGEREKCLAAGMDDYISKPVKLATLKLILNQWLVPTSTVQIPLKPEETTVYPVDNDQLLSVDLSVLNGFRDSQEPNEPDFVTKLIDLFLEDTSRRITLLESVEGLETQVIKEQAHSLQGSSGNIGLKKLAALSRQLEANCSDFDKTRKLIAEIKSEFENSSRILNGMRKNTD